MDPALAPRSAGPTPGLRPVVLVADDYPENRRLLYFYLRDRFTVVEAASAEEALQKLADQPIELAILDLNFCDGMSGIEAVGRIRRDPALALVKTLALTAYAYPDDRDRCIEAGFDGYLSKPVFKQALLDAIGVLLGPVTAGDGSGGAPPDVWVARRREG